MSLHRSRIGLGMSLMIPLALAMTPGAAFAQKQARAAANPGAYRVYVGTYTGGQGPVRSRGIYVLDMDAHSGKLGAPRLAAEATDPSFLAIHPGGAFLYAANESGAIGGRRNGGVSAFAIDEENGTLTLLNQQLSGGSGPCHLVVDRQGRNALVANYGSGSVACLPIEPDGRLRPASSTIQHRGRGSDPSRQLGPHAHSINLDADNRFAFVADLGLDEVLIYDFDPSRGQLIPHQPPFARVAPRSGPRHFAFHPEGRFGYVINEMASTITAFDYDPDAGTLKEIQTISTLPANFRGQSFTADVHVHPSGKFLYGSNRGHDSIAIFAIAPETGKLTVVGIESTRGKTPRNFAMDPKGAFLLAENQDSNTIVAFRIDTDTGRLEPTGQTIEVSKPVCIKMIPRPSGASR